MDKVFLYYSSKAICSGEEPAHWRAAPPLLQWERIDYDRGSTPFRKENGLHASLTPHAILYF